VIDLDNISVDLWWKSAWWLAGGINALQSGPFLSALAKLQSQLVAESRDVVLNCLLL
jgi:hypothetical protein